MTDSHLRDNHGITEQQWLEFSEGQAGAAERNRIEAHLAACAQCATLFEELNGWRGRLAAEAQTLRAALVLPEAVRGRMLAESLARVGAARPERYGAAEGVAMLRVLLGPVFGQGAVRATVEVALKLAAPGGISAATWQAFAAQLSEAIQSICGETAGRMAGSAALSFAVTD